MRTHRLYSGRRIPRLALGTYQYKGIEGRTLVAAVKDAIDLGYRHIDTAYQYRNEKDIGVAISESISEGIVTRQELFVVSKLPMAAMRADRVERYVRQSLVNLGVRYLDLYLIHNPVGIEECRLCNQMVPAADHLLCQRDGKLAVDPTTDLISVWHELERMVSLGLILDLGLSNCTIEQCHRVCSAATISPAVLQVELHIYLQQQALREFCRKRQIVLSCYGVLGSPERLFLCDESDTESLRCIPRVLNDPVVCGIADRLHWTAAQVIITYCLSLDIVVVCKAFSRSHLAENLHADCLQLSKDDANILSRLDKGESGRSFRFIEQIPGYRDHHEAFL